MTLFLFLDCEASSLSEESYPIEIAWVNEAGRGESYLIRPLPDWTDWSPEAEALHGISRETLERNGTSASFVAKRLLRAARVQNTIVVSDSSADSVWIHTLLRATGYLSSELHINSVEAAYGHACSPLLRHLTKREAQDKALGIYAAAEDAASLRERVLHRALSDAENLWWTWAEIGRLVQARLADLEHTHHRSDPATFERPSSLRRGPRNASGASGAEASEGDHMEGQR